MGRPRSSSVGSDYTSFLVAQYPKLDFRLRGFGLYDKGSSPKFPGSSIFHIYIPYTLVI